MAVSPTVEKGCRQYLNYTFPAYTPQEARPHEKKEGFLECLEDEVTLLPINEGVGDFSCHISRNREGYYDIMGSYGFGSSNEEGYALLDMCKNQNLRICNIYFKNHREKLITYKSGGAETQN